MFSYLSKSLNIIINRYERIEQDDTVEDNKDGKDVVLQDNKDSNMDKDNKDGKDLVSQENENGSKNDSEDDTILEFLKSYNFKNINEEDINNDLLSEYEEITKAIKEDLHKKSKEGKIYKCNKCNKRFYYQNNLDKHIMETHKPQKGSTALLEEYIRSIKRNHTSPIYIERYIKNHRDILVNLYVKENDHSIAIDKLSEIENICICCGVCNCNRNRNCDCNSHKLANEIKKVKDHLLLLDYESNKVIPPIIKL